LNKERADSIIKDTFKNLTIDTSERRYSEFNNHIISYHTKNNDKIYHISTTEKSNRDDKPMIFFENLINAIDWMTATKY